MLPPDLDTSEAQYPAGIGALLKDDPEQKRLIRLRKKEARRKSRSLSKKKRKKKKQPRKCAPDLSDVIIQC
jgi:hypothetical protein